MAAIRCWRTCSNSLSGNEGWRRISAARRSAPAKLASTVSTVAVALLIPPDTLRRAFRRSVSSWICWRVLFFVPRISKPPASCATADLPNSDFSSPNRTTTCATTVPPRVVLGSSTTFIPLASLVALQRDRGVGGRGNLRAVGALRGDELAQRAVGSLQIGFRHAQHILLSHLPDLIARKEKQPPVARSGRLTEHEADRFRVSEIQLDLLQNSRLGALHLLFQRRFIHETLEGL